MKKMFSAAILSLLTAFSASAQIDPLTHQLEAYYSFWGHSLDGVNSINGTNVGGTSWGADRNGVAGASLHLDGQSGYVGLGNSLDSVFAGPTAQFAIAAWVKLDDASYPWADNRLIVNKSADSGCGEAQQQFYLRYLDGELNFSYAGLNASFARYINTSYILSDTLWHHIVITYDATQSGNNGLDRVQLYADGQPQVSRLLPNSFGPLGHIGFGTGHLGIGNRLGSAGQACQTFNVPGFFRGSIDDVAIYSRVLTPLDVNRLADPTRNGPLAVSKEHTLPPFTLYPTSSTSGRFTFAGTAGSTYNFAVTDFLGRRISQGNVQGTGDELNLSLLSKGVYMIRFTQGVAARTQRVVIE